MSLAATRVGAPAAPRSLVMLHGIFGWGRNWQTIARAVTAARPEYACWLVDLPHHGGSAAGRHGDTIRGCAADLKDWASAAGVTPDVVLGHSFGGKVALAWAGRRADVAVQAWIIDSTPEAKPAGGGAWEMLRIVRGLPRRLPAREPAIAAIMAGGFSRGVAVWMATNLVRDGDSFVWRLDFDAVTALMESFFETDLWPIIGAPAPGHDYHFLKASTSSAMSDEAARRIELAAHPRVHLHRREGTHWIHAERPDVVVDLLRAHLP
jgi:esterase